MFFKRDYSRLGERYKIQLVKWMSSSFDANMLAFVNCIVADKAATTVSNNQKKNKKDHVHFKEWVLNSVHQRRLCFKKSTF